MSEIFSVYGEQYSSSYMTPAEIQNRMKNNPKLWQCEYSESHFDVSTNGLRWHGTHKKSTLIWGCANVQSLCNVSPSAELCYFVIKCNELNQQML